MYMYMCTFIDCIVYTVNIDPRSNELVLLLPNRKKQDSIEENKITFKLL